MEILCESDCKETIKLSLEKSLTYDEYIDLVSNLVKNKSTTGVDKSDAMVNYTMLNQKRLKRWNKTLKVSDEIKGFIKNTNRNATWLVITESWCGDAAHILPVINRIASLNENINLKIVLRDENLELMDAFLTNSNRSIPKLIMIDNDSEEVVNTYGPRPNELTKIVVDYIKVHGKLTDEFKEDIQKWYNKDKGQSIINDLQEML